ncbi:MAG TPA: 50S ribosomal protein L32 [Patescibacteria group bacterium]|nr:50S ribosomal protein L32 [Patescibacteria group bacterium]
MAVPKKKRTKGSAGKRRSHHGLSEVQLSKCPKCNTPVKPHAACPNCGTYKKREVLETSSPSKKSSK